MGPAPGRPPRGRRDRYVRWQACRQGVCWPDPVLRRLGRTRAAMCGVLHRAPNAHFLRPRGEVPVDAGFTQREPRVPRPPRATDCTWPCAGHRSGRIAWLAGFLNAHAHFGQRYTARRTPGTESATDRGEVVARAAIVRLLSGTIGRPWSAGDPEREESGSSEYGPSHSRNAKPVVRRGRNATGLTETAGLPKERNPLRRPVFHLREPSDVRKRKREA